VTAGAADVLRLDNAGRLRPGAPADLVVLRPVDGDAYESVAQATRADVRLVMIDGRALFAEPALGAAAARGDDGLVDVRVDGAPRLLARWIAARAASMLFTEPGLEVLAC
jgi:predicted amidohydrolase